MSSPDERQNSRNEAAQDADLRAYSPSETLADPELRKLCAETLAEWETLTPEAERAWTSVDELILEAQVLLMCEAINDRELEDLSLEGAVAEVGRTRRDEVVVLVRERLFDQDGYLERMRRVAPVFRQLIKGEMNRTVTRPAKVNRTTGSDPA